MLTVQFKSDVTTIKGNSLSPVPIGEANAVAVIDIKPTDEEQKYIASHTQGNLRLSVNLGSLTAVHFKIYSYTGEVSTTTSFVQTVSSFSGAVETISPVDRKITANGDYDYYFTISATNGIKVVFWGEGSANTGSALSNIHIALRTN
jgi:hypothetical protein